VSYVQFFKHKRRVGEGERAGVGEWDGTGWGAMRLGTWEQKRVELLNYIR